jgi:hypothetical protein
VPITLAAYPRVTQQLPTALLHPKCHPESVEGRQTSQLLTMQEILTDRNPTPTGADP